MYARILEFASKTTIWMAGRVNASVRCPLPLSGGRGQIAEILQCPQAAALLAAVALVILIHAVRSAWFDIYGKWYSR